MQDGLDLSSFNVRNRRYNNKAGNTNLDDINNWNSGYWATVLVTPKHAIGCRHYWKQRFQPKNASSVSWARVVRSTTQNGNPPPSSTVIASSLHSKKNSPKMLRRIEGCRHRFHVQSGSKIYQLTNQGMLHYMYSQVAVRLSSCGGRTTSRL